MPSFRPFLLKRLYPVAAFFGGFIWDALTIGRHVRVLDFWRLGGFLFGAALLIYWLAYRRHHHFQQPPLEETMHGRLRQVRWLAPYLLLQFFFGGIFSALFLLYVKSAGDWPAWLAGIFLGALLVANEFWRDRYGRRFSLNWGLFALCAILLMNFVLPYAVGRLGPRWFYLSTAVGLALAHGIYRLSPGRPGHITPAWVIAALLVLAWNLDMIAPVPLVKKSLAFGQQFAQSDGQFQLQVEPAARWQFWRDQAATAHVPDGGRLYAVSAVFAPRGVSAPLEHRWLHADDQGHWQTINVIRFVVNGGRAGGFRGYSYATNPPAGRWRLIVATQDGHTITTEDFRVARDVPASTELRSY
jgi:hypothetical protein